MPKEFVSYSFITHPAGRPGDVKRAIALEHGVYFVAEFLGAFKIFVAKEADSLEELQAGADAYWDAGAQNEEVRLVARSRIAAPKRGSPPYCAIIRAEATADPTEVLETLDLAFEGRVAADPKHEHFWYAAGVVTGRYDLLIDLGADSVGELDGIIMDELRAVPGVGRTVTSNAHLPGNEIRPKPADAS
jgi:DNA-binding Lrp family transcriptional regulator